MQTNILELQLKYKLSNMFPTMQIVPQTFYPFMNQFNIAPVQYFNPWESISYPYYKLSENCSYLSNSFETTPSTPLSNNYSEEKLTDISSLKAQNFQISSKKSFMAYSHNKQIKSKQIKKKISKPKSTTLKKNKQTQILKICQNKNRNIIPSVVQQIFSYLSKPNKSKQLVSKIFQLSQKPLQFEVSIEKYFYLIKHIKEKLNHYLNTNSLAILCKTRAECFELIPQNQQMFYLHIARRATRNFIQNQLPLLIIHSKRMFEDKRSQHMRVRRLLSQALLNLSL